MAIEHPMKRRETVYKQLILLVAIKKLLLLEI